MKRQTHFQPKHISQNLQSKYYDCEDDKAYTGVQVFFHKCLVTHPQNMVLR